MPPATPWVPGSPRNRRGHPDGPGRVRVPRWHLWWRAAGRRPPRGAAADRRPGPPFDEFLLWSDRRARPTPATAESPASSRSRASGVPILRCRTPEKRSRRAGARRTPRQHMRAQSEPRGGAESPPRTGSAVPCRARSRSYPLDRVHSSNVSYTTREVGFVCRGWCDGPQNAFRYVSLTTPVLRSQRGSRGSSSGPVR